MGGACLFLFFLMIAVVAADSDAVDPTAMDCEELEKLQQDLLKKGAHQWGDLVIGMEETMERMEECGMKTNRLRTRLRSFKAKMQRQSWWDAHSEVDKHEAEQRYEALQRFAAESGL